MVALHRREARTIAFRVHKEGRVRLVGAEYKGVKFVERGLRILLRWDK